MEKKIRIGICGYGNLGHGVELAVNRAEDMELVGVFSRRDLPGTASGVPAINLKHVLEYKDKIDVMILCGGSATDLIDQGPELAQHFVTVDSFDTHPRIPEHFANMEAVTKANNTAAIISVGWDPGLFSLLRVLGDSVLPEGKSYTFWGKGVSQGHSDAIRRIPGVKNGKQYTIPKEEYLEAVRSGKGTDAPGNEMHLRECFVVPEEGADLNALWCRKKARTSKLLKRPSRPCPTTLWDMKPPFILSRKKSSRKTTAASPTADLCSAMGKQTIPPAM